VAKSRGEEASVHGVLSMLIAALIVLVFFLTDACGQIIPFSTEPGNELWPAFSPDGWRVAFSSDYGGSWDIWVVERSGEGLKRLTRSDADEIEPCWTSDGRIVYASNEFGSFDIWIMDADGSNHKALTADPGDERRPQWSPIDFGVVEPDPRNPGEIRVVSRFRTIVFQGDTGGESNIYVMREDGSYKQKLTDDLGICRHPTWSSDGLRIIYDVTRGSDSDLWELVWQEGMEWSVEAEGSPKSPWEARRVTQTPDQRETSPTFSPNQLWTACTRRSARESWIKLLAPDGSERSTLIGGLEQEPFPAWSPEGRWIAYSAVGFGGDMDVFLGRIDDPLGGVRNMGLYWRHEGLPRWLSSSDSVVFDRLSNDRFSVVGSRGKHTQFHDLYASAAQDHLALFITTDSALYITQAFLNYLARQVKAGLLFDRFSELIAGLQAMAVEDWRKLSLSTGVLTRAARVNVEYLSVAAAILGVEVEIPPELLSPVQADLDLIESGLGPAESNVLERHIDFSAFASRGRYWETERLRSIVRAITWVDQFTFSLADPGADPTGLVQALLLCSSIVSSPELLSLWNSVERGLTLIRGQREGWSIEECQRWIDEELPGWRREGCLDEPGYMERFVETVLKSPAFEHESWSKFCLLPESESLDDRVMNRLAAIVSTARRGGPVGLDFLVPMGSGTAWRLSHQERTWASRGGDVAGLRLFSEMDEATRKGDIRSAFLATLRHLATDKVAPYPEFMRSQAWQEREIWSALGAWTAIRHDIPVYVGRTYMEHALFPPAGIERPLHPLPKVYVEPNVPLFTELADLVVRCGHELEEAGLLVRRLALQCEELSELLYVLAGVAGKELRGVGLSEEDEMRLADYGSELESFLGSISVPSGVQPVQESVVGAAALVKDTGSDRGLVAGLGEVHPIYVVVRLDGQEYLAVGGIFSYYELPWSPTGTVDDADWQRMLRQPDAISPPWWTESFLVR
jgi:Tol biopolymer transport system component